MKNIIKNRTKYFLYSTKWYSKTKKEKKKTQHLYVYAK